MPEMTAAEWKQMIRRAVQLRDRCREAAVANGARLGLPISQVQANMAYDAMAEMIRTDERAKVAEEVADVLDRCAARAESKEQVFTADTYLAAAAIAREHATR